MLYYGVLVCEFFNGKEWFVYFYSFYSIYDRVGWGINEWLSCYYIGNSRNRCILERIEIRKWVGWENVVR